jgi:hypothetical protein
MSLAEFIATHRPALERDEVRNNLILGVLAGAVRTGAPILTWTLGEPGACAIKWPGRPIILGDVTRDDRRNRIQRRGQQNLLERLVQATHRDQARRGIPVVGRRVARVEGDGVLEFAFGAMPVPILRRLCVGE